MIRARRSGGRHFVPHRWGATSATLRADVTASLVVFLVAVPLCVGVAVASGVPAELGLITGIVGGLVTGFLPGSSLQVSGPAAGLTVLVYEAVQEFGLPSLGFLVLAVGLLQILMGVLHIGRWFRAISVSVIEGMLAGIGLVLIAGQLYPLAGAPAPDGGLAKLAGLPRLFVDAVTDGPALAALCLGAGTILLMAAWRRLPPAIRLVPAPLAAVALVSAVVILFDLPVATVDVKGIFAAVQPPGTQDVSALATTGALATVLAFTLIASAESLFSAAAVDRLHDGPSTDYDRELVAQGVGNTLCGLLGALPMTAVVVRSAANVQAGARTKASRVLHGAWLLLFAAFLPTALGLIPLAALAGILVQAGSKLLPVKTLAPMWREHRGEALILLTTAGAIVALNMFDGVLIGLGLAITKSAWQTSRTHLEITDPGAGSVRVQLTGNATFLRLPTILGTLEALPRNRPIELDLTALHHLDHACHHALANWASRHNDQGVAPVRMTVPRALCGTFREPLPTDNAGEPAVTEVR